MTRQAWIDTGVFGGLITLVFAVGILTGYSIGSKPERCREIVLEDIQEHQAYEAKLSQIVNPDFLTTITKGAK